MQVNVTVAPPHAIDLIWQEVWPLLSEAVAQSVICDEKSLMDDISKEACFLLLAQVDGVLSGVAVIGFIEGSTRVADVQFLGGKDFKSWSKQMNQAVDIVAKTEQCSHIIAHGRKAWSRLWKDYNNSGKILFTKQVA